MRPCLLIFLLSLASIRAATITLDSYTVGPTTAFTYQKVEVEAYAHTDTGETLMYAWDFGDGDTDVNPHIAKYYMVPGTYTVSLTLTAGSDPTHPFQKSTTIIINPTPDPIPFTFKSAKMKLDFIHSPKDSITLTGALNVTQPFDPYFKFVFVRFLHPTLPERLQYQFVLTKNGTASDLTHKTGKIQFKLAKAKPGAASAFSFKISQAELLVPFSPYGIKQGNTQSLPLQIPVQILIDGTAFNATLNLLYNSTAKSGSASL